MSKVATDVSEEQTVTLEGAGPVDLYFLGQSITVTFGSTSTGDIESALEALLMVSVRVQGPNTWVSFAKD